MTLPNSAYDIILNLKGYLLARAEQLRGGRAWTVETVGSSIVQRTPTELQYGNQSPQVEAPMVWRTWHRGYGDREEKAEGRYRYAEGIDARFPEQLLPGPLVTTLTTGCNANVTAFAEHNSKLYILGGRYVKSVTTANDTIGDELDLGAGKVGVSMAEFKGNLYVGLGFGSGDYIYQCDSAGSWSQDDDVQRGYLWVERDKLYGTDTTYSVRLVTANPMTSDDWSAPYTIGDPGTSITSLTALADLLYIGKSDGLYALDNSGVVADVTPELRPFRHADNCKNVRPWHGSLFVPHVRGFMSCQPLSTGFVVSSVHPGREADGDNAVRGQVTAIAGDDRWLYVALYTISGDTWILAGRETVDNVEAANGRMVWHPLARLTSAKCQAMHISGLWTNPRLWFGVGANVGYIILPRYGDNPRQDANARYAQSGTLYLSGACWDAPTTSKIFKSIELITENLTPSRYFTVYYSLDGGPWVAAGAVTRSPGYTISLGEQGVAGKRIDLRLDYVSAGTKTPGVVKAIVLRAAERPEQVELITFVVRCADRLRLYNNAVCERSGATILSELKALAVQNTAVPLKDVVGLTRQVLVLPPVQEQELEARAGEEREVLATVRAAVFAVDDTDLRTFRFAISGSSGGMEIPLAIPWAVGATTLSMHQTVPCAASVNVRPVIVIEGPVQNLVIENETTGKTISFDGTTIASGDSYIIDLASDTRTIVDEAGTDVSGDVAAGSDLYDFYLAPGDNVFDLTGLGIDQNTAITVGYAVS